MDKYLHLTYEFMYHDHIIFSTFLEVALAFRRPPNGRPPPGCAP